MLTNRKEGVQTTSQIGCVSDVEERTRIHNSKVPTPGSERRARQAAGWWKALLIIVVPASSGLSAGALARLWKTCKRKIHCRFQFGIESIARHYGLPYFIDVDELRSDARIAGVIPAFVRSVIAEVAGGASAPPTPRSSLNGLCEGGDDDTLLKRVADLIVSPSFSVATCEFDGVSFAKKDRPRDRYRKRKLSSSRSRSPKKTRFLLNNDTYEGDGDGDDDVTTPSSRTLDLDALLSQALSGTLGRAPKRSQEGPGGAGAPRG